MKRRWKWTAALLLTLTMATPALGATVVLDGRELSTEQGWVAGGISYITLSTISQQTDYQLGWDGRQASLSGNGLDLVATPGEPYVMANGRALYVDGGVQVVNGRLTLPMEVVAQATGAHLRWDSAHSAAHLNTETAKPQAPSYDEQELYWLSRIISAESRGEPLLGQIAVGNVVLNRVASPRYPDTVQGVVFDRQYGVQFEPVSNGTIYDQPTQSALLAAKLCLEGADVVGDSLYFYAPALSPGTWIVENNTYLTTIGCHRFYR